MIVIGKRTIYIWLHFIQTCKMCENLQNMLKCMEKRLTLQILLMAVAVCMISSMATVSASALPYLLVGSGDTLNIDGGGSFIVTDGTVVNSGNITGAGSLDVTGGTVTNSGNISPGTSPGILNISGDYTQDSSGSLNIELGGTTPGDDFDQLNVTSGAAVLAGSLNVTLINGFTPVGGNQFEVVKYDSSNGSFDSASLPGLPSGYTWNVNINPTSTILQVVSTSPPTVTLGLSGSPIAEIGGVATVTATLSHTYSQDVTVNLAFSGTASDSDYNSSGTSITITSGNTSGTVTLTAVHDTLDEHSETIIVDISSVTNGTESGTQQVTATITDDDVPTSVRPTCSTVSATSVGPNTATLNGTVNPNGSSTAYYFKYGLTTGYGSTTAFAYAGTGTGNVAVNKSISGLAPNTIYHYRLFAENGTWLTSGADLTFATQVAAPFVFTGPASFVGTNSVILNGEVNPNGAGATYYFEYGTTVNYGTAMPTARAASINNSSVTVNISASIGLENLTPNTTYHYRLVATNVAGTTYGANVAFTTLAVTPVVTTGRASSITINSATLNGMVNPNGASTLYYFEYGTTTGYGPTTPVTNAGTGTGTVLTGIGITGLDRDTTYHYRLTGTNSVGTSYGSDMTFMTNPVLYPFSYSLDKFTQVSGDAMFVDDFNDDVVPPYGPGEVLTYVNNNTFSSDAETGGYLDLDSDDGAYNPDNGKTNIFVYLKDNDYYLNSSAGGSIKGRFRTSNGIAANSGIKIEIFAISSDSPERVALYIYKTPDGGIVAGFNYELNGVKTESTIDITDLLSGITDTTLKLDVNKEDVVTASLDFGSDGTIDLELPNSHTLILTPVPYTLTFVPGLDYTGSFEAYSLEGPP